jgi:23S rRNA (guanosine2251-2'-O)-methyltransferase
MTEDLLWGKNPVMEAIRAGRAISRVYLQEGMNAAYKTEALRFCRANGVPYQFADSKRLTLMSGSELHQGIVVQAAPKEYTRWTDMTAAAASNGEAALLIILDGVEDPHNLGAILRCADALGAHGVVIPKNRAVPLTSGVARASAGAIERVPVDRVTNISQEIERMKEHGLWIAGADMHAASGIDRQDLTGPMAVVFGGEGKGLSRLIREKCDFRVSIPMREQAHSLNVSAAAAVVLYEISRQRRAVSG